MDRIGGVPNGWRLVRITDHPEVGEYAISFPNTVVMVNDPMEWDLACIVERIKPLKPKYRPFANAAEFEPHRNWWVRVKRNGMVTRPISYTHDRLYIGDIWLYWGDAFSNLEFETGTPFGVEVVEA